jgi:NTP pyrophosphatase (non-canonical NTP hydrolase)
MQRVAGNPRAEVAWFADQMELKLKENDHKVHWSECSLDFLIHRLYQEADELWNAIRDRKPSIEIIRECADVANFAMMIADNVRKLEPDLSLEDALKKIYTLIQQAQMADNAGAVHIMTVEIREIIEKVFPEVKKPIDVDEDEFPF